MSPSVMVLDSYAVIAFLQKGKKPPSLPAIGNSKNFPLLKYVLFGSDTIGLDKQLIMYYIVLQEAMICLYRI